MRLMRDLVGDTLSGRYRLVARIAGGGMGEVYRGHDLLLDRSVAVKILQHALADDPDLVERFRQEARAAARLAHPNVVAVHDWGAEDDRTYYMVMEYVAGTDLRDLLVARGSLEPAQAAEVLASVCDALSAAHAEGLVHRDIKPENVLIARTGKVKVADFGIAAIAGADLTNPGGGVSGTLRYLAPEQARGEEASVACDIWAAGAVLAECLTGRPPAQGSGADLLRRRAEEEPQPPSRFDPFIPADLDGVVMRACALRPEGRYHDSAEMAMDLKRIAVRSLPDAAPVSSLMRDITTDIRLPQFEPTSRSERAAERKALKRKPVRSRRRRAGLLTTIGVLVALLALAGVGYAEFVRPQPVDVPSVVEMQRARAVAVLESAGLEADIEPRKDKFVAEGIVLEQAPENGRLLEGRAVTLIVSAGPPKVRVPLTEGLRQDEAEDLLRAKGFELGKVRREHSLAVEEGRVISVSPAGHRLFYGATIELVVSRGPQPVKVPAVAGLTAEKAARRLKGAGFEVEAVDVYSDETPAGRIVSTAPAEGAMELEGSTIEMQVSIGPEFEPVKVPDVRGKSIAKARAQLAAAGLGSDVRQSCGGGGTTVVETDPIPGTTVRESDVVALFVC